MQAFVIFFSHDNYYVLSTYLEQGDLRRKSLNPVNPVRYITLVYK